MSRKNLGSGEVYRKDIVRIGYIGLGGRGRGVPEGCVAEIKDVDARGICDLNPAKMDMAENILKEKGRPAAARYTDYHELLRDPEIDAVMLMTGWNGRIQMAIDCLEAGKRVAIEVGCAYDITECRKLVEACERTGIPCMMPENSCCERREMMILKPAKEGFFGGNRPVRRRRADHPHFGYHASPSLLFPRLYRPRHQGYVQRKRPRGLHLFPRRHGRGRHRQRTGIL